MSLKFETVVGILLISAVLLLCGGLYWQHKTIVNLRESENALTGDATAATTYSTAARKLHIEETQTHERVEEALAANPEWSDQPLPADVADLLRDPEYAKSGVPEGLPDYVPEDGRPD